MPRPALIKARDLESLRPPGQLASMHFRKQAGSLSRLSKACETVKKVSCQQPDTQVEAALRPIFGHPQEPTMKKSLVIMCAMVATLSSGFFLLENTRAIAGSEHEELRVDANLYRVKIGDTWHNVPLMPLSDSTCRSPSRLIRPYCN